MDEVREICCRYACLNCGHEWHDRFQELVHIGRGGEEHDLYLRRGVPCPNPEHGTRCPRCGDLRVHLADEHVRSV